MSTLSRWVEREVDRHVSAAKRKAREWCRSPDTIDSLLTHPKAAAWLSTQPPEVAEQVRVGLAVLLEVLADKWFGG